MGFHTSHGSVGPRKKSRMIVVGQFIHRTLQLGCLETCHKVAHSSLKIIHLSLFLREAVVVQMTWPGAPTVYYGDEAGVCGFTDPDNRRTYPWGKEDVVLVDFHRDMIRIHKENEALRTGSLKLLQGEKDILCYGRFNRTQQFVVILNNSDEKKEITKEVWSIGIPKNCKMERLIITTEAGYSLMPKEYEVEDGRITVTLLPHSAAVLKYKV